MKNSPQSLAALAICLLLTVMRIAPVSAATSPVQLSNESDTGFIAKRNSPPSSRYLRLNEIKSRTARDFVTRYPYITDAKWLRSSSGYTATFSEGEIINNVHYDRGGFFINTIRYFADSYIPEKFKARIQKTFNGYSIVSFIEVIDEKGSSIHVHIKNRTRIKSLIMAGENIEVVDDFRNASVGL